MAKAMVWPKVPYCPNCGMNRFGDLRFCPSCGFDYEDIADGVIRSEPVDPLLVDAVKVIREYKRVSAALLQRRLEIGYARAASMIEELEARGYIGPSDGSNARQVLRDAES